MVIEEPITYFLAHHPVPECKAYFAYTTFYKHRISKFGLPEILVTENGSDFYKQ